MPNENEDCARDHMLNVVFGIRAATNLASLPHSVANLSGATLSA